MDRHPDHDAVAAEVRSWYTDWSGRAPGPTGSTPDLGVTFRREAFGYLRNGPGRWDRRVLLTIDESDDLGAALDEAEAFYGQPGFDIWIDDQDRAARLETLLLGAGFEAPADNTVVLALVGDLRAAPLTADIGVREATGDEDLELWSRVKLRAFSDSEEEPEPMQLAGELASRQAERSITRYEMAMLGDEAVAILAHYTASIDQMVFQLATRVPFRHRGIAQGLLLRWSVQARDHGARSLLINCDQHGRPGQLYRRMGFTDEVYWHRRYQRRLASTGRS